MVSRRDCNIDPFWRCDHPSGVDGRSLRLQTCRLYFASQRAPSRSLRTPSPATQSGPFSLTSEKSVPLSLSFSFDSQRRSEDVFQGSALPFSTNVSSCEPRFGSKLPACDDTTRRRIREVKKVETRAEPRGRQYLLLTVLLGHPITARGPRA